MKTRFGHVALAAAAVFTLAGCGGGEPVGPSAAAVVDEFAALYPVPNPQDNTAACEPAGCLQLITTDRVSVYQWPDEASAQRWAADVFGVEADVVGNYVLGYGESPQAYTGAEARTAFAARLQELLRT